MLSKQDGSGFIDASQLYTLLEFRRRLRLGAAAMRTARRKGLPLRRLGRAKFVLGADAIKFFAELAGGDDDG